MDKFKVIKCETGKLVFPDKKDTRQYIKLYTAKSNKTTNKNNKLRPYECNLCGYWHTTSQSKQEQRRNSKYYSY